MPATDFGWSLNEKPPIFQVYGTKRKCSSIPADEAELVKDCPKRRCLATDETSVSVSMEMQHETVSDHCLSTYVSQQIPSVHNQQPLCSHQHFPGNTLSTHIAQPENNNHLPSLQAPVFQAKSHQIVPHGSSQHGMMIELPVEVNSTARLQTDDLRDAAASMEAEESPDPQHSRLAYCDRLCLGGDVSPTSRRVRCFCMPSWEGLIDGRQYLSDYY